MAPSISEEQAENKQRSFEESLWQTVKAFSKLNFSTQYLNFLSSAKDLNLGKKVLPRLEGVKRVITKNDTDVAPHIVQVIAVTIAIMQQRITQSRLIQDPPGLFFILH